MSANFRPASNRPASNGLDRDGTSSGTMSVDDVVGRSFSTVRKGLDELEVREWLRVVGAELAAARRLEPQLRDQIAALEGRGPGRVELSGEQLLQALGDETSRVLRAAQEAADDIRRNAEERASSLVREAHDESRRLRDDARTVLERKTVQAETTAAEIRDEAERIATSLRADAETTFEQTIAEAEARAQAMVDDADVYARRERRDADDHAERVRTDAELRASELVAEAERQSVQEIETARTTGREMVGEAQAVRERMLSDLARRKAAATARLDDLRAGRDRLLEAYRIVRLTLEEATEALTGDSRSSATGSVAPIAGSPVRSVGLDDTQPIAVVSAEEPSAPAKAFDGQLRAAALAAGVEPEPLAPLVPLGTAPRSEPEAPALEEAALDTAGLMPVAPEAVAPAVVAPEAVGSEPVGSEPVAPDVVSPMAVEQPGAPEVHGGGVATEQHVAVEEAAAPSTVDVVSDADASAEPDAVDVLFSRLRESTVQAEADGALDSASAGEPGSVPDELADRSGTPAIDALRGTAVEATIEVIIDLVAESTIATGRPGVNAARDAVLVARRDEAVEPLVAGLVRRVRRSLQDEQNELLHSLRRSKHGPALTLLPELDRHLGIFQAAALDIVQDAYSAGVATAGGDASQIADAHAVARELTATFASELVLPLRERLAGALAPTTGDWSQVGERLGAHYRELKTQRVEAASRDVVVAAWARGGYDAAPDGVALRWVVDPMAACPDAEDNALEPTAKGCLFPTGQAYPPAHPGCRCFVVEAGSRSSVDGSDRSVGARRRLTM